MAEKALIPNYYPAIVVPKALAIGPKIKATFAKAYKKGVPIGFGTDAAVFPHGDNAKEFIYMKEAGMPVMKAIQAATIVNAKILEIEAKASALQSGVPKAPRQWSLPLRRCSLPSGLCLPN